MKSAVVFSIVLAAFGCAQQAQASDRAPVQLSVLLDEVDRASPQLLAMRARAAAAADVASQREALPDPKLSAVYTNDGLTSFTLGDSEFANLAVGWEQEVPSKAVRRSAAAVANAQVESLQASTATAGAALRARIITLYTELWRIDRTSTLLDDSRTLLVTAAQAAQARYESGEGIQEGLIRAQSAVRRVDLQLIELSLARRQAEIALGAATGREDDPEFGATGDLPEVAGPIDEQGLAAAAAASSPEVLETSARDRTAEAQLDDARSQAKPTYAWLASYQFRGGLDPMVMGGFSVRLPVWKDRKQQRAIAGAESEREAAVHDRDDAVVRARAGARGLAAQVASIDARLRLYDEAIVPQAVSAYESANAAFASGRAEMGLVLDDLDRWTGARRDALALSAQRIEAIASLEAITGTALLVVPGSGRSQ
jgi:outer membrane protein TolC